MKKFYIIPRALEWKGIQAIVLHKINNIIQNAKYGVKGGDWADRWNPYTYLQEEGYNTDWDYQTELTF